MANEITELSANLSYVYDAGSSLNQQCLSKIKVKNKLIQLVQK